jgi:antirestriction protein ArdC
VEGSDLAWAWQPLVELAATIGSCVEIGWTEPAHGYYDPATKRIVISEALSINARVKTLVHEVAHALVRADRQPDDPGLSYAQEELVVESIAFSVTGTLGLDTGGCSIPYLTSWSTNTDLGVLEATAKLINRLASRIEDACDAGTEERR